MKKFRYLLIALSLMTLSCEREQIKPEPKVLAVFNAVAEKSNQTTKVSIDQDYVLSWDQGDKIKVWDGSSELLFIAQGAGKSVDFQAEGVVLVSGQAYGAAYPESLSSFTEDDLKVYVPNTVVTDPAQLPQSPAVAQSNGLDTTLEFRNVCGLISFNVVGDDIVSITVEGANQEVLSGWVSVDPLTGVYNAETITESATRIEISGPLSGLYSGKYYVPILPQNFANGLKVTMHTMNGADIVREFPTPFELKRSYYYDLEGVDQGRYFRYEISTAEQLQQFLDDAKDCEAHVVATLVRDIDLKGVELNPAQSFNGTFNGNSKKLKNWEATAPLFRSLSSGAVVRNLTIASSCSYVLSEDSEPQAFIVGVNNGLVNGCTNEASVSYTLSDAVTPVDRIFGTLVGECNNKVTDCTNLGNVEIVLSAQTGAQHIGGLVGTFNSPNKTVAVENCTNQGNITVQANAPHYVNLGGVCAQGCNGTPVIESETVSVGSISGCVNKGEITLVVSSASEAESSNVGGVIGYAEGNIVSCINEATGKVNVKTGSSEGAIMTAPSVGGVAGTVIAGYVSGSSNAAPISIEGAVQAASAVAAYTGGNVNPAVGGIVAKIGKAAEDTSVSISDCTNTGAVTSTITGNAAFNIGGIVGWTSVPVTGSGANRLHNNGAVTVAEGTQLSELCAGGVIGRSISTFDHAYNGTEAVVTVYADSSQEWVSRVGGVAGYMEKMVCSVSGSTHTESSTFKRGHNNGNVVYNGGKYSSKVTYIAGVVAETRANKVSSESHSWSASNANYGNITVDSPAKLCVGGVIGKLNAAVGSGHSGTTERSKFQGSITVTNPGSGSCIGGVLGIHGRGQLGNANGFGESDTKIGKIVVTGADANTYVGGYVGYLFTDNGAGTTISGCGFRGEISAEGATAGVIAGYVGMTGKSCKNVIKLGSSASEKPKISKTFKLNGVTVGEFTGDSVEESHYFGKIAPSTTSGNSVSGQYFFQAGGTNGNLSSFKDGLLNL